MIIILIKLPDAIIFSSCDIETDHIILACAFSILFINSNLTSIFLLLTYISVIFILLLSFDFLNMLIVRSLDPETK